MDLSSIIIRYYAFWTNDYSCCFYFRLGSPKSWSYLFVCCIFLLDNYRPNPQYIARPYCLINRVNCLFNSQITRPFGSDGKISHRPHVSCDFIPKFYYQFFSSYWILNLALLSTSLQGRPRGLPHAHAPHAHTLVFLSWSVC